MPKVLHLIDSFNQGGTERQAVQLVRLLRGGNRYHPVLASLNGDGILRAEAEAIDLGEIPEYRLSSFYDRNFVAQLRRFVRHLRMQKVSIVHTHDFYSNIFGMAGAALARIPVRIASKRETEGFRTPKQEFVERCAFRVAHRVIANSSAVRTKLTSDGVPESKVAIIYNGLDVNRTALPEGFHRELARAELRLPADRSLVSIIANVEHAVKDHPTFLRAARRVRDAFPGAAFVVAGEGRLLEELRHLADQLGLSEDVFFIGRCQRVSELLAISEVCVLSSRAEGFANAILEYMAAGRPSVVTDVGGAREAIVDGTTGFIVAPGHDATMAERILTLLNDRERAREMGESARRVVAGKFSCAAQVGAVESLYDSLLATDRATVTGVERAEHEGASERVGV
jgi:glycosyltransferase involved in cell wall biosynthesis